MSNIQPLIAKIPVPSNSATTPEAIAPTVGSREYATMLYTASQQGKGHPQVKTATAIEAGYPAMPIDSEHPKDALGRNDQGKWTTAMPRGTRGLEGFYKLFTSSGQDLLKDMAGYDPSDLHKCLQHLSMPDEEDFQFANSIADDTRAAGIDGSMHSIVASESEVDQYRAWEDELVVQGNTRSSIKNIDFDEPDSSVGVTGNYMCFGMCGTRLSAEPKSETGDESTIRAGLKTSAEWITKAVKRLGMRGAEANADFMQHVSTLREQFVHLMQTYGVTFVSGVHQIRDQWDSLTDFMLSVPQLMKDMICVARAPADHRLDDLKAITRHMYVTAEFFKLTSASAIDHEPVGCTRTGHEISIARSICGILAEKLTVEDFNAEDNPYIPEARETATEPVRQLAYYKAMSRHVCTREPLDEYEKRIWNCPFYQWWTDQAELMEVILSCVGSVKHTKYVVRPWTDSMFIVIMISPSTEEVKIRWAVYKVAEDEDHIVNEAGQELLPVKLVQFGSQPLFRAQAMLGDFHALQKFSATINPMVLTFHMAQLIGLYPCEDIFTLGDLTYYFNSETYTRIGGASVSNLRSVIEGYLRDKMPRPMLQSWRSAIYLSLAIFGSIRSTPAICFVPKFFSPQERKSQASLLKANEKEAKAQEAFARGERKVNQSALLSLYQWMYTEAPLPTKSQSISIATQFGFRIQDVVTPKSSTIREGDIYVSDPCNSAMVRFIKDTYSDGEEYPGNGALLDVAAKASQVAEFLYRGFAKQQTDGQRFIATTNPPQRTSLGAMRGAVLSCGSLGGRDTNIDPSQKHASVHKHTLLKQRGVSENRAAVQICMDPSGFGVNFPYFASVNAITIALAKIHGITNDKGVIGICTWVNKVGEALRTRYLCFSTEELDRSALFTLSGGHQMTHGMSAMAYNMWKENEHAYRMMVEPYYHVDIQHSDGTSEVLARDLSNWRDGDVVTVSPKEQWPSWDIKGDRPITVDRTRGQVYIKLTVGSEEGQTAPMESFTWTAMVMHFVEKVLRVSREDYAWTNCADDGLLTILLPSVAKGYPQPTTLYQTGQDILSLMVKYFHSAYHVDLSVKKCVVDVSYPGIDKVTPFFYNSHMIDPLSAIPGRYCSHICRTLRNVYKWRLYSSVKARYMQYVAGIKAILSDHPDTSTALLDRIGLVTRAASPSWSGWAMYHQHYRKRYEKDHSIALIGHPDTDDWRCIFQHTFALDYELAGNSCLGYYKDGSDGVLILADEHREYDGRQRKMVNTFARLAGESRSYGNAWKDLDLMKIMGYEPHMAPFDCSTFSRFMATRFSQAWNGRSIFDEPLPQLEACRCKEVYRDMISGLFDPDYSSNLCRHIFVGKASSRDDTSNPVEVVKFWIANGVDNVEMPSELMQELVALGEKPEEGEKFEPIFCRPSETFVLTDTVAPNYEVGESVANILKTHRECSPVVVSSPIGYSVVKSEDCNGDFYMIRDGHLNCVYNSVSDCWRSPTELDLLKTGPFARDLLPVVLNLRDADSLLFMKTDMSRMVYHMRSYGSAGQITHFKVEISHSMLLKFGTYLFNRSTSDYVDRYVDLLDDLSDDDDSDGSASSGDTTSDSSSSDDDALTPAVEKSHRMVAKQASRAKRVLLIKRIDHSRLRTDQDVHNPVLVDTSDAELSAKELLQELIKLGLIAAEYNPDLPIAFMGIQQDFSIDVTQNGRTFTMRWPCKQRRIQIRRRRVVVRSSEMPSVGSNDGDPAPPDGRDQEGGPDPGARAYVQQGYMEVPREAIVIIHHYLSTRADQSTLRMEMASSTYPNGPRRVAIADAKVSAGKRIWEGYFNRMNF